MNLPEKSVTHHIPNAIIDGQQEFLETILYNHREAVDAVGPAGYAAIHVAAFKGDMDMINMLLRFGARLDLCAGDGDSCAHIACRIGNPELFDYFIEYCKDIDYKNKANETMQDICERIPTEEEAYSIMYKFKAWNTNDEDAHVVLRDKLHEGRNICRDKIILYRKQRILTRRQHLVDSYIRNADDRKLGAKVIIIIYDYICGF